MTMELVSISSLIVRYFSNKKLKKLYPDLNFISHFIRNKSDLSRGGARGGLGGLQPPRRRHLALPSEEIFGSRRRKFGKITHENTIFQSL